MSNSTKIIIILVLCTSLFFALLFIQDFVGATLIFFACYYTCKALYHQLKQDNN